MTLSPAHKHLPPEQLLGDNSKKYISHHDGGIGKMILVGKCLCSISRPINFALSNNPNLIM